jgi:hypothetical protein
MERERVLILDTSLRDGEQVALLAQFDTMNRCKIPTTLWNKLTYGSQRLVFHAASFLSLNLRDQSKFLWETMETLRGRILVWRGMLLAKFRRNPAPRPCRFYLVGFGKRTIRLVSNMSQNPTPVP